MRSLDALVANRAMNGVTKCDAGVWFVKWHDSDQWDYLPAFSSDIAAAWTVAEELNKVPGFGLNAWVRFIENWRMYQGVLIARPAAEAAKCICIAALIAIGVTEDEINATLDPDEWINDRQVEEMRRKETP
jgi:prenyltransferase beta subunit